MARLTEKTLAQSSALTPTTLIHIVTTGDTSQNPAGSSYKAELNQIAPIIGGYQYYSAVTITSGETLTLFSLPVEILPAPGVNKYYDFKVYFEYTYNSSPYTSNTLLLVDNTNKRVSKEFYIEGSDNVILVSNMDTQQNLTTVNSNLLLSTTVSDPTGGDGSLKIKIWYNVVDFG
jgi:hypothetical protein